MSEQEMREKVIKGLEHEIGRANIPTCGTDFIDCVEVALLRDALALLKAQEPVTVICSHDYTEGIIYRCPKCKDKVYKYNGNYCSHCGQAVKWK